MRAHIFDSSGDAYDAVQVSEDIKTGDILIIASEKIVGIADTWPIAVSKKRGKLHHISDEEKWLNSFGEKRAEMYLQLIAAQELAAQLEW